MTTAFAIREVSTTKRTRGPAPWSALVVSVVLSGSACQADKEKPSPPAPAQKTTPSKPASPPVAAKAGQGARRALIRSEPVEYQVGQVTLKGYLAYDSAVREQRPGVLVVHEWWGHNEYARGRARALAGMGYTALAVDMYGDGKQAEHPDDAKKFSGEVMSSLDEATRRFQAAHTLLKEHSTTHPEQVSAIGYCFGGGVVLEMARRGLDLDGVASFHGMLGAKKPAEPGAIQAKVLVLHGEADPFVPPEQVAGFKREMSAAGADFKFVGYPGAQHAFTVPGADEKGKKFSLPLAYDAAAARQSWSELEAFLRGLYSSKG